MDNGWIKLHRKITKSTIWNNPVALKFWVWCLLKATHKEYKTMVGFQEITLLPGEFIFTRRNAAIETGISEQTIRTCLKSLENIKNLTRKPTSKYTVLSICNWETYQISENITNPTTNQQLTSNQPTTNQQLTHIQEQKEYKEHKETLMRNDFESEKIKQAEESSCYGFEYQFSDTADEIFELWKTKHNPAAIKDANTREGLAMLLKMVTDSDLTLATIGDAFRNFNKEHNDNPSLRNYGLRGVAKNIGNYIKVCPVKKPASQAPAKKEAPKEEVTLEQLKSLLETSPSYLKANIQRQIDAKEAELSTQV